MVQNFAQRRREEFNRKKYDESAAKLRLPKQYLSTDKDRGARYRGVKGGIMKHFFSFFFFKSRNISLTKSLVNKLQRSTLGHGRRLPQRTVEG
jgi:hypothetical protein